MVGWVSLPCAQAVMGVERGDALAASIATHGLAMVDVGRTVEEGGDDAGGEGGSTSSHDAPTMPVRRHVGHVSLLGVPGLKGEPLARETAFQNWRDCHRLAPQRFFSSLVFDTVAPASLSAWHITAGRVSP